MSITDRARSARSRLNAWLPPSIRVGVLLIYINTTRGKVLLNRVAERKRFWTLWHNLGVVTAIGLFGVMAGFTLLTAALTVRSPPDPSPANNPANALLIPGVNDMMPLALTPYILVGVLVGATVHELGHAISARVDGITVEEMGAIFFGPLPLGAYVKPDYDELEESSAIAQLRMYSAGVMNNTVVAAVLFPVLVSSYTATVSDIAFAYVVALFSAGGQVSAVFALGWVTNLVFWVFFVNINLALVNALPIIALDGGYIFGTLTEVVFGWLQIPEEIQFDVNPYSNQILSFRVSPVAIVVLGASATMLVSVVVMMFGPHFL